MGQSINSIVAKAQQGEAAALEQLVLHIQDRVHRLALRMVGDPSLAQDATQEILIRVVTKLSTFKGDSKFETWVYRVATNYLLTAKKVMARDPGLTFEFFAQDLLDGLADDSAAAPEDHVMLNELRVRCTMAMLLCLDANHRAAYVLGEILEMDHREAAIALDVPSATYRQRLSRARSKVLTFTAKSCGLANSDAPCSCPRRLPAALASGRIGDSPSVMLQDAPSYRDVRQVAAKTEAALVVQKLQQATGALAATDNLAAKVLQIVNPPDPN
ncbi:RNA polymerase sigma factor [Parasedimentitalea maritima]|uniref:Sigma-70 family RNA polymerase sigma factor n=1 Tax=Parasedimentitalea maritima TaxID=2578117 RepID=A0A6A4RLB4_9RHOB|nr:sigma-70 family RNA polymerase sigma factor [Zongyanglinia marina]KAE9632508.1 sigma-70 family RNA polymerase sigma factor [Zongyanglinia marina]